MSSAFVFYVSLIIFFSFFPLLPQFHPPYHPFFPLFGLSFFFLAIMTGSHTICQADLKLTV